MQTPTTDLAKVGNLAMPHLCILADLMYVQLVLQSREGDRYRFHHRLAVNLLRENPKPEK